jgi:ABC-type molybdate transport system substrate-binding protein
MLQTIFAKAGIDFAELNRTKRISRNRSGGYVANMVTSGNADAAMCWQAVAVLRKEQLDIVDLPSTHLPTPGVDAVTSATGRRYVLSPVHVTVATLKCADQPEIAKDFATYLISPEASATLKRFGFTVHTPSRHYTKEKK